MTVEPREAAEGSVFRFTGRNWRPDRRVRVTFGVYCRPGEACIDVLYLARVRTDAHGKFSFRLRAGQEQAGDDQHRIRSGGHPTFSQRAGRPGHRRTVSRSPRYVVNAPAG
ncbi:MAG TPA: hypothetical protein VGO83_08635 [Thermoleophilaceae bacterium]|nr:hypothetical protein [Thermoleophilaceae bacterium]